MVVVVAATERELTFVRGAETLVCGVGPVDAAASTARLLASRPAPDGLVLMHVGLAGSRGIEPPALVLGSESVYSDVVDPGSAFPRVARVLPDARLLARARETLPEALVLPIATAGRVNAGTGCAVEAMEGFGVLRAAALAGVPAFELRALSNLVGEPDRAKWRFDEALASLEDAVGRLLAALD
jgi:nucleoside phosphorylase